MHKLRSWHSILSWQRGRERVRGREAEGERERGREREGERGGGDKSPTSL